MHSAFTCCISIPPGRQFRTERRNYLHYNIMHLIESTDRTYSNKGKEWHGKAIVPMANGTPVSSLERNHISPILFPLMETALYGDGPNSTRIPLPDNKLICADLSARGESPAPLGIHSDKYMAIENSRIFDAVETAMDGTPHTLTTAGTLDGCKRFYMTVELSGQSEFSPGGEPWKAFLNFITSHDGSLALRAYDSGTRIVCNNTLIMSLSDKGSHALRIKHSNGSRSQLDNFPKFLENVLHGRQKFADAYTRLMESPVSRDNAFAGLVGMYWQATGEPEKISTRAENQIAGIMDSFQHGKGNNGSTFADLLNGYTEFFTSGEGCGKDSTAFERAMTANFGSPADKKNSFLRDLVKQEPWGVNVEAGKSYMSGLARNRAVSGAYGQRATVPAVQPVAVGEHDGASLLASLLDGPFQPKQ